MTNYIIKNVEDLPKESAKKIEIEIGKEEISKYRAKAIKTLVGNADIPGFRKGHVPEKVIIEKVGEAGLLEEAINAWLKEEATEILAKETPDAISFPKIEIKKAVPGNPVELSFFVPLKPKLNLPDYKKIATEKNAIKSKKHEVADKEIDDAVMRLRKYSARAINPALSTEPKEEELPPLNDQFAESIGGGKTVAELRERIKKDLESEHTIRDKEKRRWEIIEAILKNTEGAIPEILVDYEIEKMEAEFENDVKRMGLKMEDYLKNAKKTHEDLHKEWHAPAEKRARVSLILNEIKKIEKIEADKKAVDEEVKHFLEHYKDADIEQVRMHVERMISNEKVFEFLESQ
jgi:trigger factor